MKSPHTCIVFMLSTMLMGARAALLQVDMSNEDVSPDGVHVMGNFNDWNPAGTQMHPDSNGIYAVNIDMNEGDNYIFINGNSYDGMESVQDTTCGGAGGMGTDRFWNPTAESLHVLENALHALNHAVLMK